MKKIIFSLLLLLLMLSVYSSGVMADGLIIGYKIRDSSEINNKSYLTTEVDYELGPDYLMKANAGMSGVIEDDPAGLIGEVNIYRKLNLDTGFNYYVGGGYDYHFDQKSQLMEGGKLSQNSLFISLLGANIQDKFSITSRIDYSPVGAYKYMDHRLKLMTTWKLGLNVNYRFTSNMKLLLGGEMGRENSEEFSSDITTYKIGLQWDI
ncbi:MAG: hypothetical protein ACOCQH_01800 [Halanaerobiales bacterium]